MKRKTNKSETINLTFVQGKPGQRGLSLNNHWKDIVTQGCVNQFMPELFYTQNSYFEVVHIQTKKCMFWIFYSLIIDTWFFFQIQTKRRLFCIPRFLQLQKACHEFHFFCPLKLLQNSFLPKYRSQNISHFLLQNWSQSKRDQQNFLDAIFEMETGTLFIS